MRSGSRVALGGALVAALLAGCYGAGAPTSGAPTSVGPLPSPPAVDTSNVGPSPTIGYCGMDPEPVPCVDRPGGGPQPTSVGPVRVLAGSCSTQFPADRCQALAFEASHQLGVGFDQIAAVDVVPNPSPDGIDFGHRTFLSVELANGSRHDVVISCPGIAGAYDPPCMALPTVPLSYPGGADARGPYGGGYTDTPEDATPFPALDPVAVAGARPLRIARLDLPITAIGPQTMVLGTALLPNGYLAEGGFALADPWPSDILFNTGPSLDVRPTAGGDPLRNLYEHGWHKGDEEVTATLTFDVAWFEPGASLTIVNIVVR